MKYLSVLACLVLLSFTSCIKDEKPNIEADIIEVLSPREGILNVVYKPTSVDIYIDPARIDPRNVSFDYRISQGATILPDPQGVSDYSTSQSFIVTSEGGNGANWMVLKQQTGSGKLTSTLLLSL